MVVCLGYVEGENDVGYAEYGTFPAYGGEVVVDLTTDVCWQQPGYGAAANDNVAGYR